MKSYLLSLYTVVDEQKVITHKYRRQKMLGNESRLYMFEQKFEGHLFCTYQSSVCRMLRLSETRKKLIMVVL